MRDILNLLDSILTESTGLANRPAGTSFANPQGDQLIFQGVKFYPEGGGSYSTPDEWQDALNQVTQQVNIPVTVIQWVDSKGNAVPAPKAQKGGFGLAQFDGVDGKRYYLGRHLKQVSPIPTENSIPNILPGGYRLQTAVAQKEAAGYKPTDVLSTLVNLSPQDVLRQIQARFGADSDEARATEIFMSTDTYPIRIPLGKMNYTAFTNYFCEMLQPIALVMGKKTTGSAQKAASKFLTKGGYTTCSITFGSSKTGGLTDSVLVNPAGQTMGLSSKAEEGAKASAKNLADKIDEIAADPDGQKFLKQHAKDIKLIKSVTSGSTPGSLDTAVIAKIITQEELDQIMAIRKLPPGSEVLGKNLLSKNLEKKYQSRIPRDPSAVIPFFHIRAAIANEVASWVNENTNFGKVASEILNWGAFIQAYTHADQKGDEIILKPFDVVWPSTAVTNVLLSAEKTFYSTGSKGNFTFIILYNGATDFEDLDNSEDELPGGPGLAKTTTQDLDTVSQTSSGLKASAGGVEKKVGTPKTLGRKRQQ